MNVAPKSTITRDDALAHLEDVKVRKGLSGRDVCLNDPEYLSAAWRVVELNEGLIGHVLKKYRGESWYWEAWSNLNLTLFGACWPYNYDMASFGSYAMPSLRHAFGAFLKRRCYETLPYYVPINMDAEVIRQRIANVQEKARNAQSNEEYFDAISRVASLARVDYSLHVKRVHTRRWSDGEAGERVVGGEQDILETLVDTEAGDDPVFQVVSRAEQAGEVLRALSHLTKREQIVLSLRFGVRGEEPLTLQEVGGRLAVSRERVRQIETHALSKLRRSAAKWLPDT